MSITAIILSYKREKNLQQIVTALKDSTVRPDDILVVNNNPTKTIGFKFGILAAINCGRNLGCPIRHLVGLTSRHDWLLFHDDDIALEPRTIENLLHYAGKYPKSVLGLVGRDNLPYSKSPEIRAFGNVCMVDVVIGKIHFCSRQTLANAMPLIVQKSSNFDWFSCDDIALSLANKRLGNQNFVVPYTRGSKSGYVKLDEWGIGLGHAEDWWERRNQACRVMLEGDDDRDNAP